MLFTGNWVNISYNYGAEVCNGMKNDYLTGVSF